MDNQFSFTCWHFVHIRHFIKTAKYTCPFLAYLFEIHNHNERVRESKRSFIHWLICQMSTKGGAGSGQVQEPRTKNFTLVSHTLDSSAAAFLRSLAGNRIYSGVAGTRTSIRMGCWHCGWWLSLLFCNAGPSFAFL